MKLIKVQWRRWHKMSELSFNTMAKYINKETKEEKLCGDKEKWPIINHRGGIRLVRQELQLQRRQKRDGRRQLWECDGQIKIKEKTNLIIYCAMPRQDVRMKKRKKITSHEKQWKKEGGGGQPIYDDDQPKYVYDQKLNR